MRFGSKVSFDKRKVVKIKILVTLKLANFFFALKNIKGLLYYVLKLFLRALKQAFIYYDWTYSLAASAHKISCLLTIADYHTQSQ